MGKSPGQSLQNLIGSTMAVSTRRRLNMVRIRLRTPSALLRFLPDFLVIGVQRGGTSSLFKYLSFHPEIAPSLRKETEFFTRYQGERGLSWYRAHFPLVAQRWRAENQGRRLLTFEATPTYLDHPHAPALIAATMPETKLIVLLRDPIARAHSHHQHLSRLGVEVFPFAEAVRFEEERIRDERARVQADPSYYSRTYTRYCYAYRGMYADHLVRWLAHFPRASLLAIRSEGFYANPSYVLKRIFSFVGVEPRWKPPEFKNYSYPDGTTMSYGDMDSATRQFLQEKFDRPNRNLVELLGPEFSWA
jgi:Sulfotransferase domain